MSFYIVKGSILDQKVDAIVVPSQPSLRLEGVIGGKVEKICGDKLKYELRQLKNINISECVITNAYNLDCKKIIHVANPKPDGDVKNFEYNLQQSYLSCLELAQDFELESIAFCKGTINFIFDFLHEQKNKQIFKEYSTIVHLLFGRTGVRNTIPDYYLQRSLMCFTTHYGFGFWSGGKWKFMNDRSLWHKFLNDSEECEGQPHNQCMKSLLDYLYKDLSESLDLSHYSEEYSRIINRELLSIIKNNNIEDWRYYFIKYPSIWSEMLDSMCCWENDYNIILLHRTQNRDKSKSELRSYAFWQDVISDRDNSPNDYANWEYPQFFKEGDTCMYINHTCNSRRVVAIDLFYERGKANQYRFRIFYRLNEFEESEKTHLATFEELKAIAKNHCFEFNEKSHKYYSPHYSYKDAMRVFKELLEKLGEI